MIGPTHERPQFQPSERFTDRERWVAQFITALDAPQTTDNYRVLNWFGVGGQGKTALMEEFERILKRRHQTARDLWTTRPGFALIDFDNPQNRAISTALLSLREKLIRPPDFASPSSISLCCAT